jgi:hypothetical protein
VCDDLRETALRDDAAGWLAAWRTLDSTVLAALTMHAPLQLTLCGEQHAQTWGLQQAPWWRRLQQHLTAPTPAQLLASL